MTADDRVVAAVKDGDPDAWRELYRAHAGRLLVWLEGRSPADGGESAEDLAAETWLTAARKVHDFRGDSSEFAGWLFGIARHLAANARRRSGRRRTSPSDHDDLALLGGSVPGPESVVPGEDWVRAALATLSPRERDVVTCVDVLGLDTAATATALGMTSVAVRVTRHRGLKRLRQLRREPAPDTRADVPVV